LDVPISVHLDIDEMQTNSEDAHNQCTCRSYHGVDVRESGGGEQLVSKNAVQRQRIGPQIRHLRQIRGLTLDDLASSAGLSASHLSRLERSQTLPSFTVLANIAQVLGVSIDEFVKLEHDLQQLDEKLSWQSQLLGLDDNAYQEILNLSIDTRRQLNRAIETLSGGRLTSIRTQEDISELFEKNGSLTNLWPKISKAIAEHGMSPVGLSRGLIQLIEIPGDRYCVLSGPGLLPVSPNIETEPIYRALFPALPLDPAVARRWYQWHHSARDSFPFEWSIKLIVHKDFFERLKASFAANDEVDGDAFVKNVAQYWRNMLEGDVHLQIAVTEQEVTSGNVMIGGGAATLFEEYQQDQDPEKHRVGLWISSHHLVKPIIDSFEETWDSLPERDKDHNVINDWIARHC
jgi:transcriptional regulator with XRE-family HTH domain